MIECITSDTSSIYILFNRYGKWTYSFPPFLGTALGIPSVVCVLNIMYMLGTI